MNKQMLQCDICGGTLEMQAGGKVVTCTHCGMTYSVERVKEIYSGMKVSVTGTTEDVNQWKALLQTYVSNCDFIAAEQVVKKILEAVPSDQYANDLYIKLQDWKEMDIRNGVLVNYKGQSKRVIIPEGVTQIGAKEDVSYAVNVYGQNRGNAFSCCTFLEYVEMPDTVVSIKAGAFWQCDSLQAVRFSKNLSYVGHAAFAYCSALRVTELPMAIHFIGRSAFEHCAKLNANIPTSVTEIGSFAFRGCNDLVNVAIPAGISKICLGTFSHCKSLECVDFTAQLHEIESEAFSGCVALTKIILPEGITIINRAVFSGCSSLANVVIPSTVTKIDRGAFSECKSLRRIEIPSNVKEIVPTAFAECASLYDVKHSNSFPMTCEAQKYSVRIERGNYWYEDETYECHPFARTPYADIQNKAAENEYRRQKGLCLHCGGNFKGFLRQVCSRCGKVKDY